MWKKQTSFKVVKYISIIFGLLVPENKTAAKYWFLYSFLILMAIFIGLFLTITLDLGKFNMRDQVIEITLNTVRNLTSSLTSIISIITNSITKRNDIYVLNRNIEEITQQIDGILDVKVNVEKRDMKITLMAIKIMILTFIIFDAYFVTIKINIFCHCILWYINIIIISFVTDQIYLYARTINLFFSSINNGFTGNGMVLSDQNSRSNSKMIILHEKNCDLIETVNKIFGLQILLITLNIRLSFIWCFTLCIRLFTIRTQIWFYGLLVISCVLNICIFLVSMSS